MEELELSHTTSVCVCVDCIYASVCVTVYERAYLQPCIFVSSPHSVHVLQLVAVVTAADMWPAGCVLCMGGMRVAFLSHTDPSLSPSPFCRQCFMSTNRPARKLVTEELEGRETDWKVTQPAGNICVCVCLIIDEMILTKANKSSAIKSCEQVIEYRSGLDKIV